MFGFNKPNYQPTELQAREAHQMLETISPLINKLYASATLHVLRVGLNKFVEILFYIIGIAILAFPFIMERTFPFHVLGDIIDKREFAHITSGKGDIELFALAVKGLVVGIGLLFIAIGMMIRKAGIRKSLLQSTGKELKKVEAYFKGIQEKFGPLPTPIPTSAHNLNDINTEGPTTIKAS
ncbi:MAG: hypothetical protein IPI46_11365 [Bacteroidetes bacterium]|nr:hypothetical protein [Bacteroidota bacterium]